MTQAYNLSQLANNLNTAGQLDATDGLVNAVPAANGGTGQSVYAVGDVLYASTTTALAKLPDVATGNVLISGGVGAAPSYGKVGLTTHISGTLPVANGGTGATTLTANNVLIGAGTSAVTSVAPSTSGNVLTSNGTTWASAAPVTSFGTSGSVAKVAATDYTNGATTKMVVIFVTSPSGLPTARRTASVGGVAKNWTEVTNFNGAWAFSNQLVFMVPPGAVYRVDWSGNTGGIGNWYEAY